MLPYILLVRANSFLEPQEYFISESTQYPLITWIYEILNTPILQNVVVILLIFLHAIYINRIAIKNRIPRESSLFAGIIYILLVCITPELCKLTPELIANSFILFGISQLFKTYKNPNASLHIFNTGLMFGIAAVLSAPLTTLILYGLLGFTILRSFKRVEKLQYISGFIITFYLAGSVLYIAKADMLFSFTEWVDNFGFLSFVIEHDFTIYLTFATYFILFLICFFSYNSYTLKKSIQVQKKIDLLYWLSILTFLTTIVTSYISIKELLPFSIVVALMFSMNLSGMKNKLFTELIHITLLTVLVFNHYVL